MFLADLGLVKLIPKQDKCTLASTYQCLTGAVHLKALTLASPLRGGGVGWGRRKQQQKLKHAPICAGWVGGEISVGTSTAGDHRSASPHPLRQVSQVRRTCSLTPLGQRHGRLPC